MNDNSGKKSLVIWFRNTEDDSTDWIEVNLPDNSGTILKLERKVNGKLHSIYGHIST